MNIKRVNNKKKLKLLILQFTGVCGMFAAFGSPIQAMDDDEQVQNALLYSAKFQAQYTESQEDETAFESYVNGLIEGVTLFLSQKFGSRKK